jgi:hypothetical protein
VPFIPSLVVEQQLADTIPPAGWMDPETLALVTDLTPVGTALQVDVERAVYRLSAALTASKDPGGHCTLRDEVRSLLRGEAGRDGYLPTDEAPAAIVCALHGALAHKHPVIGPLLFRAIATATARGIREQPDADGRALAAAIALDFSAGKRQASGYSLPSDDLRPPTRLLGHVTRPEESAA